MTTREEYEQERARFKHLSLRLKVLVILNRMLERAVYGAYRRRERAYRRLRELGGE